MDEDSTEVDLAIDAVHGRDECDGHETDDEPMKMMTIGSKRLVKCLTLISSSR